MRVYNCLEVVEDFVETRH